MTKGKRVHRRSSVPAIVNSPFRSILLFVSAFFLIAVLIGINFQVKENSQAAESSQAGSQHCGSYCVGMSK